MADKAGILKADMKAREMQRSLTPAQLAEAKRLLAEGKPSE
jgi:hypothetical protein